MSLSDGTSITSASEICRYLCSEAGQKSFYLDDTADQAIADQWMSWEASKLQVCNYNNHHNISIILSMQSSVIASLKSGSPSEELHACLKKLEDQLSLPNTKYLIPSSTSLSLVDIAVWATLYLLMAPENSSETAEGRYNNSSPIIILIIKLTYVY